MSDTHMNRESVGPHMRTRRGQLDLRTIGIIVVMLGLAALLFMITKGMFARMG